jgi:uncharacterized protein YuzE
MKIRITQDQEAAATYIYLQEGATHGRTVTMADDLTNIDFDTDGNVVGIEIMDLPSHIIVDDVTNRWHDWKQEGLSGPFARPAKAEVYTTKEGNRMKVYVQTNTVDGWTYVSVQSRSNTARSETTPNGTRIDYDADGNLVGMQCPGLPETVVVDDITNRRTGG